MAPMDRPSIRDPERIRALTHPLRITLLDLLQDHGELTATQCAELSGESVASCSFHLRMLEKYGFIERAEKRGKEKPWKMVTPGSLVTDVDPEMPGSLAANVELAAATFDRRAAEFHQALDRVTAEPEEWVRASKLMHFTIHATADEVDELADELDTLLERFRGRKEAPSRPIDARRVRVLTAIHVDPPEDN